MGENTAIAWTDNTWNPWQGCHKVSSACDNCYMYREKKHYGQEPSAVIRSSKQTFNQPFKFKPGKVFACSWSDFFIQEADPWRSEAWSIIRNTPWLTYQILTKRPERIMDCLPSDWGKGWPNIWLGVTAENREMWDERVSVLKPILAAVHFVSYEPALGPLGDIDLSDIEWIICGGESGPNARPMHPDWARSLRDQCMAAGVPFFFKQWGEWVEANIGNVDLASENRFITIDGKDMTNEPIDKTFDSAHMVRVGKKAAGHLLDGQEWRQFPKVSP